MPFQMFVNINGKTHPITAQHTDTVAATIAQAISTPPPDHATIKLAGKSVASRALTLGDLNAQPNSMLSVSYEDKPAVDPNQVPEVLDALTQFLRISAGELSTGEFTFISVGCFDNGHGGTESIQRQQCPQSLLDHCIARRVDLNIVLVDRGFGDRQTKFRQVYDLGGWNLVHSSLNDNVRQYMYGPAAAARACDIWLTVFATHVPEYRSELASRGETIAALHIPSVFAATKRSEGSMACGNFYTHDPSQYFTLGDPEFLKAAGIEPNPIK